MKMHVSKTTHREVAHLRNLFLRAINCQFIHNAYHERDWADVYLFYYDDIPAGYTALCGGEDRNVKDTVFEFFVLPEFYRFSSRFFSIVLDVARPLYIESQSNDVFTSSVLLEFAHDIKTSVVLFEDGMLTNYSIAGASFRLKKADDKIFEHYVEGEGEYVVEWNDEIVATGGFLQHYNAPFADLYMEVKENCRKKGFGAYIIQELKKVTYQAGKVPAARCNLQNKASKATLIKAGMKVVAFMQKGNLS